MTLYDGARYLHILAGTIALGMFWTAAFLRKGRNPHRFVGRAYLIGMIVIMMTAIPLAVGAFQRGFPARGTFFLYLIVITSAPSWLAWRAIRDKQNWHAFTGTVYRAFAWGSLISGAVVLAVGLKYSATLLIGFSFVGLVVGFTMLRFARKPPVNRSWWLQRHYVSIIGCGIATHVAFLGIGLQRMLPAQWNGMALQLAFFVPVIFAVAARWWLDRRYKMRGQVARALRHNQTPISVRASG